MLAVRPYHHGNLKQALLEAAIELIAETGPRGFTLREAARRAGVSHNAPYRHFRDRDDLLAAVATDGFDRLTRAMAPGSRPARPTHRLRRRGPAQPARQPHQPLAPQRPGLRGFRLALAAALRRHVRRALAPAGLSRVCGRRPSLFPNPARFRARQPGRPPDAHRRSRAAGLPRLVSGARHRQIGQRRPIPLALQGRSAALLRVQHGRGAGSQPAQLILIAYRYMNPTVLITGASGGIGEELARLFAAHRHDLVLVARSERKLQSLCGELARAHGIQSRSLAADLADPGAPPRIFEALQQQGGAIDVLVNNAGFGACGAYAEIDYEVEARMIQVNVAALAQLTRLFLPGMLARRNGKILNVASTAAYVPGPFMAVYYASKAFVLSFSEAIAEEMQGSGVTVTALIPGPTETNFAATAGNQNSLLFRTGTAMSAAAVARVGYDGLMAGKRVANAGLSNKLKELSTLPSLVLGPA